MTLTHFGPTKRRARFKSESSGRTQLPASQGENAPHRLHAGGTKFAGSHIPREFRASVAASNQPPVSQKKVVAQVNGAGGAQL